MTQTCPVFLGFGPVARINSQHVDKGEDDRGRTAGRLIKSPRSALISGPSLTNLEVLWPTSPSAPSAFRPGGWGWRAGGRSCRAACCHSPSTPPQARSAPERCRWRAAGRAWPRLHREAPGRWRHWRRRSTPSPRTGSRSRPRPRRRPRPPTPGRP